MNKLWSPWRSEYIDSFNAAANKDSCVFCEMRASDINKMDNLLVHSSELTFTVLNLYPYNNGHLMVVPVRHLQDLADLSNEENSEIMIQLQLAQKALTEVYRPDGYNVGANLGKVSGAGIADHIHFHLVPRWTGDTNFMPVLGEVKVISQDLLVTKEKLLQAFSKLG